MQKNRLLIWVICLGVWLTSCQPLNLPNESATATAPADWIFYHHPKTGLSFYYPPDVEFNTQDGPEGNFGYAYIVHRPEGQPESVNFYVLSNPEHWSLDDFIVAHSAGLFAKPEPTLPREEILRYATTFEVQGQTAIRLPQSRSTLPLVGAGKYITFIASGDWVVAITIGTAARNPADMGWEPTVTGQQIYDAIIATVKFQVEGAEK
jgi:hypothetical protein